MRSDHKNIAEPKVGSGKFYKNTTKILHHLAKNEDRSFIWNKSHSAINKCCSVTWGGNGRMVRWVCFLFLFCFFQRRGWGKTFFFQSSFPNTFIISFTNKGGEKNNSSTPILRHQVTDKPGLHDGKPRAAEGDKSLPNIFVVSTISVFLISSLVVLVLVVIRSSLERRVEARESTSMSRQSQQSSPVIEIMTTHAQLLVQRDDASEGDAANEGDVASEGNVRLDNTYYVDAVMCR